jgi:hypothetical protein
MSGQQYILGMTKHGFPLRIFYSWSGSILSVDACLFDTVGAVENLTCVARLHKTWKILNILI